MRGEKSPPWSPPFLLSPGGSTLGLNSRPVLIFSVKLFCDAMLAKLARWLRMFGYDTELASESDSDAEIVERARLEERLLLSRDKKIIDLAEKGLLVPFDKPVDQMRFLVKRLGLQLPEEPVARYCSVCNGLLVKEAKHALPRGVSEGWKCVDCGQQYWAGAHWKGIKKFLEEVKS